MQWRCLSYSDAAVLSRLSCPNLLIGEMLQRSPGSEFFILLYTYVRRLIVMRSAGS
jgi:hypothetical protein